MQSSGPWAHSVPRAFLHYAGLVGLLEPYQRNRTLDGSSVFRAFTGPSPGHLKVPSYVCRESVSKLTDALDSSQGSGEPCSLRSLENTRVAFGPIEGPKGFADVCVLCVRVLGGKASQDRGPCKHGPSYVCMRSTRAFQGPGTLWRSPCLASHSPASWAAPGPAAAPGNRPLDAGSGNRFAPLLLLEGEGGRSEASWRPLPSASRGGLRPPRTPPQSSEARWASSSTGGCRCLALCCTRRAAVPGSSPP